MNEMKVRVWHKYRKVMKPCNLYSDEKGVIRQVQLRGDNGLVPVDAVEVMFSTGVVDKNGRDIFLGDIVRVNDVTCRVIYENGRFLVENMEEQEDWEMGTLDFREGVAEVLGNVYQNEELMKPFLKVFYDGHDCFVGVTVRDAIEQWGKRIGADWFEESSGELTEWDCLDGDKMMPINHDGEPRAEDVPEGAEVVKGERCWVVSATAGAWARHNGRHGRLR